MKDMTMMKMKCWMMALLLAVVGFSAPVKAMTLEGLEQGAGAAVKHLGGGAALNDDEQAAARNFEQYVRNFYRWVLLIGIYSADSQTEAERVVKLAPTEEMRDIRYFSTGIGQYIKAHKREGMDTESVEAEGVLLAWYLSQHPNAGFWQKAMMAGSLRRAFGDKYPGQEKVEADLDAQRMRESKSRPKPAADAGAGGKPAEVQPGPGAGEKGGVTK
jgi:hypothetical protein